MRNNSLPWSHGHQCTFCETARKHEKDGRIELINGIKKIIESGEIVHLEVFIAIPEYFIFRILEIRITAIQSIRKMTAKVEDPDIKKIIQLSHAMRSKAYCPYSNFHVGAALLCKDGTIFTGCNVENASLGLSICAERTALVKAVSEGHRDFKAIAVSGDDETEWITPCGACRQFLVEFGKDYDVYFTKPDLTYLCVKVKDIIPYSFGPENLKRMKSSK